jgi:predicted dehydrogenase
MKAFTWGIIGPGKIANKFAVALTMAGNARLGAVASRDISRAREFAEKHGGAAGGPGAAAGADSGSIRVYDRYEQLAADPAIDAVYIATPHGYHAEHALLCLQQGKAVLCEKPMALSARQVKEMTAASVRNRAFLMEAMWTRWLPLMETVRHLIKEGRIGDVRYVRADFGFLAPFNPGGRLYDLRLGGGSLLDIGIYPLYLCLEVLGKPESIKAAGHLSPTGSDDVCHAVLGYGEGRSAVFSSNLTCQTSLTAEIAGTKGMIRIPTPWYKNDRLTVSRPDEEEQSIQLEPVVNGFEYQIREVQRCLSGGLIESPLLSHAFSLTMSEVMDEIRKQIGVVYPGE